MPLLAAVGYLLVVVAFVLLVLPPLLVLVPPVLLVLVVGRLSSSPLFVAFVLPWRLLPPP